MDKTVPLPFSPPATNVRHGILALIMAMAVLLYLDRICLAAAAPDIRAAFDLDLVEMGWVFNAFFVAYALFQVPVGWLGDRFGVRFTLTAAMIAWSLATALTAGVADWAGLVAVRLLLGVGQAGGYPLAARVNSQWVPFPQRALASGLTNLGGRAGGALAPWLTVTLILTFGDWRPCFLLYGAAGLVWAVLFGVWFREKPSQHGWCNQAEVDLVSLPPGGGGSGWGVKPVQMPPPHPNPPPPGGREPDSTAQRLPWKAMLQSRSLWLQCLMQATSNLAWAFFITWLPTVYLQRYGTTLAASGLLSSLPLLAGMAGSLLGGLATDYLTRRLGLRWGRGVMGVLSKSLAAASVAASLLAGEAVAFTIFLVLASFANDLGLGAMWAYFQDTGGPYVATLLGWANMFGNLGGALSPVLLGYLATHFGWTWALGTCAGMFFLAGLCWLGIDAGRPLDTG